MLACTYLLDLHWNCLHMIKVSKKCFIIQKETDIYFNTMYGYSLCMFPNDFLGVYQHFSIFKAEERKISANLYSVSTSWVTTV